MTTAGKVDLGAKYGNYTGMARPQVAGVPPPPPTSTPSPMPSPFAQSDA